MSTQKPHLLHLLIFIIITLTTTSISTNPPTVYELLPKFGLPSGLLPNNVKSYSLSEDGSFEVELDKTCYIDFDYKVYYDKKITGTLKYGSISNLDGIQVKRFFLWLGVDEISVDLPPSDNIYFQVGLINKKLDVDQFETVHACGDKVTKGDGSDYQSWKRVLKLPTPVEEIEIHIGLATTINFKY
ncbi:putative Transmembrane protein [Heracleum sosnowskyi]|uniref:Transmembrane protein n=1 Tax=Heracleum sosnowskyi TaxID=360622 RepID=A0AAD8IRY5_9APIA|nr:putative Transmembrane protein [Heracleum sosnowskyi]